jgi:RNA polymerase sigma factor (sigma-70 family)
MPFRDKEIRDETGEVVEIVKEQFPKHYLSNESEEHALFMRKRYKRYITYLSYQFSRNSGVEHTDLVDEAYLGLARAVRDFRTSAGKVTNRNPKFHRLAVVLIREALTDAVYALDSPVNVPFALRETHYYLTRIMNILNDVSELELDVEDEVTAVYEIDLVKLGVPEIYAEKIRYFKDRIENRARNADTTYEKMVDRAKKIPRRMFVDSFYTTEFNEATVEIDDERLDKVEAIGRISKVLDDREYEMLMDYEMDGFTVEMLKDKYDVSIGRVSQILNRARKKVRKNEDYIMTGSNY